MPPRGYRKRGPEFLEPYKTGKAKPPRGGKIRQKMSAQRANGLIRANEVLRLVLAGKTPEEIREATGYASRGAVMDAYYRSLDENYYLPNAKMRLKEIARLERLHAELWPLVIEEPAEEGEEPKVRLGVHAKLEVVDRILKIGAQRQKVAGLEQAPETNQQDRINKAADIERAIAAYIRGMVEAKQPEPSRDEAIKMLCQVNPAFDADMKGILPG